MSEWLVIRVLLQRACLEGTKTVLVLCLVSYWSHVRSTILPFEGACVIDLELHGNWLGTTLCDVCANDWMLRVVL